MISYAFAIVVAFSLDMLRFLFCNIATTISLVISKLDNIITTFQGDYIQTKFKSKEGEKMEIKCTVEELKELLKLNNKEIKLDGKKVSEAILPSVQNNKVIADFIHGSLSSH